MSKGTAAGPNADLLPYEKDLAASLATAEQYLESKVMSQSMRSMYETERTLQECQSFIMQLRIDQKSMPPSNKKRDLKNRICEYNAKFYAMESKFKRVQQQFKEGETTTDASSDIKLGFSDSDESSDEEQLLNESCDMEFDVRSQRSGADKEMQVEGRLEKAGIITSKSKKGKKALSKTEKQL